MNTLEIISIVLNFVLGGGLIAAITAVATLRSSVKEAEGKAEQALAEAKRIHAQAQSTELDNEEKTIQIFKQYVYEPIQKEATALRRSVNRLNRAIDKIVECPTAATCPVRRELQEPESNNSYDEPGTNTAL